MTQEEERAAADRIITDPNFAQRVYEQPEAALTVEYGLDTSERQAVHRALVADVDAARGEVEGYQLIDWGSLNTFPNVTALSSPRDQPSGRRAGKVDLSDIHFTKPTDASSP